LDDLVQQNIETGVDKLVDIIGKKKKISIDDAAKELGVSKATVQEWADFLEDEGLISVEDHLSKTYLFERKLSKGEVEKKAKEFSSKKDAFVARVEAALSSLQKESEGLSRIKQEFDKLKDAIGSDIDLVKEELSELKHYEDLKKNMDKEILQQRLEYQNTVDQVKKKILEERKKYESFLESIGNENSKLVEAKVELNFLEKKEETLQKRLEALQEVIKTIRKDIDTQNAVIKDAVTKLESKIKNSERIRADMKSRMELEMEPIMKKIKNNEEKVLAVQEALLKKVMAKHKNINDYKLKSTETADKLKNFFERRSNIQQMLEGLEKDKNDIEKDLKVLMQKATSFNAATKDSDVKKYIKELQDNLNKIEKKKTGMLGALGKLTELIGKKD
jgi:predicted ArsR family transcriptional regulator